MTWCHHYLITLKARHIPGCDGQPSVQVEPSSVNRTVTGSSGSLVSPVPDQNAWDIDALNIDWLGLTAYAYPPMALLYMVIQKVR